MINDPKALRFVERRIKSRMKCNYPAVIQGSDSSGLKFEENGKVINMSRSGVFMVLNKPIPDCREVLVRILIPTGILEIGSSKLSMVGTIVRLDALDTGAIGVAIKFNNYRIT